MRHEFLDPRPGAPIPSIEEFLHAGLLLKDYPRAKRPMVDRQFWFREPGLYLPLSCAIAVYGSTDGSITNPGTSHSFSHDNGSGSDRFTVVVSFGDTNADHLISCKIGGVSCGAVIVKTVNSPLGRYTYMWGQAGPSSGSQTVLIEGDGNSMAIAAHAITYTGVHATNPDSSSSATASSATSVSPATTVVAANCWLVAGFKNETGQASAGTNTTSRQSSTNGLALMDSNGTVATGSRALQATIGSSSTWAAVIASLQPAAGGGGGGAALLRTLQIHGLGIGGVH